MRFRSAVEADAGEVRELVFSVLEEYGLSPDPAATDSDLFDIESSYTGRGGCFELLLDDDDRLAGCYGLYPLGEGACELRKMYLYPACRGKGWGRDILIRALEQARLLGFGRVQLETAAVLKEAIRLYESFGFRQFEPDHMSRRCDVAMCLDLTPLNPGGTGKA